MYKLLSMSIVNPFTVEAEAERYHNYRPKYHHMPFTEVNKIIGHKFERSLDVACGTGHSTEALSVYSNSIVGVDLSEAMLSVAKRNYDIDFVKASAEDLPFKDHEFDFINISMAFHWLNQDKFLNEANRVLQPGSYITINSYSFLREINDTTAEEKELHNSIFKKNLKQATRNAAYPTENMWRSAGFKLVKDFNYKHTLKMSSHQFSNLLMTWSNYQVLDQSEKKIAQKRIYEVYDLIFSGSTKDLNFGGRAILLEKL